MRTVSRPSWKKHWLTDACRPGPNRAETTRICYEAGPLSQGVIAQCSDALSEGQAGGDLVLAWAP